MLSMIINIVNNDISPYIIFIILYLSVAFVFSFFFLFKTMFNVVRSK